MTEQMSALMFVDRVGRGRSRAGSLTGRPMKLRRRKGNAA